MDADKGEQRYDGSDGGCSDTPSDMHAACAVTLPESCVTLSVDLKASLPIIQSELMLLYAVLPELLGEMEQDHSEAINAEKASKS